VVVSARLECVVMASSHLHANAPAVNPHRVSCDLVYICSGDLIMLIMKCGIDPKLSCYVGVHVNSKIKRCIGY